MRRDTFAAYLDSITIYFQHIDAPFTLDTKTEGYGGSSKLYYHNPWVYHHASCRSDFLLVLDPIYSHIDLDIFLPLACWETQIRTSNYSKPTNKTTLPRHSSRVETINQWSRLLHYEDINLTYVSSYNLFLLPRLRVSTVAVGWVKFVRADIQEIYTALWTSFWTLTEDHRLLTFCTRFWARGGGYFAGTLISFPTRSPQNLVLTNVSTCQRCKVVEAQNIAFLQ